MDVKKRVAQASGPWSQIRGPEGEPGGVWGEIPVALEGGPGVWRSSGKGWRRRDVSRGAV
jgi:hypothetical protein